MQHLTVNLNISSTDPKLDRAVYIDRRKDIDYYDTLCLYCADNDINVDNYTSSDFANAAITLENEAKNSSFWFWVDADLENRKGMLIDVYYNDTYRACANGGISEHHEGLLLVGENIPQIFDAGNRPRVTIEIIQTNKGDHQYLSPLDKHPGKHYMAGGSFGYTSDSRVLPVPLKIHDRTED